MTRVGVCHSLHRSFSVIQLKSSHCWTETQNSPCGLGSRAAGYRYCAGVATIEALSARTPSPGGGNSRIRISAVFRCGGARDHGGAVTSTWSGTVTDGGVDMTANHRAKWIRTVVALVAVGISVTILAPDEVAALTMETLRKLAIVDGVADRLMQGSDGKLYGTSERGGPRERSGGADFDSGT